RCRGTRPTSRPARPSRRRCWWWCRAGSPPRTPCSTPRRRARVAWRAPPRSPASPRRTGRASPGDPPGPCRGRDPPYPRRRTTLVRNSATVWRIASATRSGRWLGRRIMSKKARARVHDPGAVGGLHQLVRLPQHALGVPAVRRHDARRQLGALPQVMVGRLRGRDVEAVVETVLEALQDVALVLEGVTRREMQLPRHDADDHAGVSERATSSIRYASIRSPTFRSLKFSTPMP